MVRFRRDLCSPSGAGEGIVRGYDSGVTDGQMFYAMELLLGKDLWEHVRDRGTLRVNEVLAMLAQVADALAYLHDRGLTHRDVNPHRAAPPDRAARRSGVIIPCV